MPDRDKPDPDDGEDGFFRSMPHQQRARHEAQADCGGGHWDKSAVTICAPTDGDSGYDHSEEQADFMNFVREEKVAANPEPGNEDNCRHAMNRAQSGKANAELVEALAKGSARLRAGWLWRHAEAPMIHCII